MVPHFPVLHFPTLSYGPTFSSPAFSCPAIWSSFFWSCIFWSCIFSVTVHADIRGGSSWPGRQTTLGVVVDGNFWRLRWLHLRKLQRYGKQYYMTICYPLWAGNWLQNEWSWAAIWCQNPFSASISWIRTFECQKIIQPLWFCGVLCIARSVSQPMSLNESSTSSLSWSAGVWRTKLQSTLASTALRSPPSAADIYDQPTSISWLHHAVGGLHLAVGLSLWQARRSGTHYRQSFVICLSVLMNLDAAWRRYCSRDISALSAIEMHCIILLYKFLILFYSM